MTSVFLEGATQEETEAPQPEEEAPVRPAWRRVKSWLIAGTVLAALGYGCIAAGERFYNPESRIPMAPGHPVEPGLLGTNDAVEAELQAVNDSLPLTGDLNLELTGEVYKLEFPRTVADRLFGKRDESATIFAATLADGSEMRFLALAGGERPPTVAVEAPSSSAALPGPEGVFVGLPRGADSGSRLDELATAVETLVPVVEEAPARTLSPGEYAVFGPFGRGDAASLRERIDGNIVLDHLADALESADADVSLTAFAFLVRRDAETGVIRALYQPQLRLVQEPLWGSSETSTLAHELAHAFLARVTRDTHQALDSAATYFEEAHPRLFVDIVGHLYERLDRLGRAEESIAFVVGSIAAGQTRTIAPARLLQSEQQRSVAEPILLADVRFLVELGLLAECMRPASLGFDEPEITFDYYDAARQAC